MDRELMWGLFVIHGQELMKVDATKNVWSLNLQSIDLIIAWIQSLHEVTIHLEEIHDCIRNLYRSFSRLRLQGTTSVKASELVATYLPLSRG
ncbi:MAG: hypothetical protein CL912_16415 [Deltaproteobacteria bacterium]|nr:hypothetical protein [Deltaproteobacteria bacterium]